MHFQASCFAGIAVICTAGHIGITMYEEFFSMKHTPFTNRIPTDCLYLSDAVSEGLGRLCYAADQQLFAVVTAEVGCGKTTLIRRLTGSLDPERYLVLYLSDSQLTPRWFYNGLLQQLGTETKFYRGDAKLSLHQQLEYIRQAKHKKVVTIVDEAHLLKRETLEEIRFMDFAFPETSILRQTVDFIFKSRFVQFDLS